MHVPSLAHIYYEYITALQPSKLHGATTIIIIEVEKSFHMHENVLLLHQLVSRLR